MKMRTFLLWLLVSFVGCEDNPSSQPIRFEYQLGNNTVTAVLHEAAGSKLLCFNMHDDENTAVEAGYKVISLRGGRLLELQHSGNRLVDFQLRSEAYRFDPNRIFTSLGVEKTLERYSQFTPEAYTVVQKFADALISDAALQEAPLIITLHNNSDGDYSAKEYLPGGDYAVDAKSVHIQPGQDLDDFFFVTEESLYQLLKEAGWNVVLQNNGMVTDDGSLSVWAGREGIPYVNVEAQHGHLAQQVEMILEIFQIAESHFN